MKNNDKDDYKVGFSGGTISKSEYNKVRVAFLFAIVGITVIGLTFGLRNKFVVFIVASVLAAVGYFGIAKRIYKK
jgi:uncharacterized membrane protein YjjP (DUF1212 family)